MSVPAAAAAGKPCLITRDADPYGERERAQAAVIVETNLSSIVDGLTRAAGFSRDQLQAMGARARAIADAHFTWPSIAGNLMNAYRRALETGRRRRRPCQIMKSGQPRCLMTVPT
jgi:glycosyltransferase involved in cell wall biosynthesis